MLQPTSCIWNTRRKKKTDQGFDLSQVVLRKIPLRRTKVLDEIMIIGIAGGTGSGKTTITETLVQRFGGNVSVVHHDNYYKAHHDMPYEERCLLNYDHPDAFDTDRMVSDLKKLKFPNDKYAKLLDIFIEPMWMRYYQDTNTNNPVSKK